MAEVVNDEDDEDSLAQVGEWSSVDDAHEHALVALAMNVDCWVRDIGGAYVLEVEPEREGAIRREFSLYAEEQAEWRERVDLPVGSPGVELALLWVLSLLAVFIIQGRDPGLVDRFSNSSVAIYQQGQWWRAFTALFLHADGEHLLGNLLIGGVFCILVANTFGQWRGWLLIMASGTLGNLLTAAAHAPGPFRSIGASTATFGALGLLVGMGMLLAWKSRSYRKLKPIFAPLAVGLALLGWFGVGGTDTDVVGHLLGWASGCLLGLGAAWGMLRRSDKGEKIASLRVT